MNTINIVAKWLVSDDTGISSRYLASYIIGEPLEEVAWPRDPADFGRCFRLAQVVPPIELLKGMELAATKSDKWNVLLNHWNELAALFEKEEKSGAAPLLYKRMKELGL